MMTEFGLIALARRISESLPKHHFEGIGDDCAVLPIGNDEVLCYTADLVVEGVHFLRHTMTPEEVAHKALHVNLSDVASMGLCPVATLLSVALPRDTMQGEWAERFMQGYVAASERAGVALIGGDTTASERDIVINVTAIGRGKSSHVKRRNAARPGDWICVVGSLGASSAGLRELLDGRCDTPLAQIHKSPMAQIEEGAWLGEHADVHAMMDLSDGIASDLRHILHASQCDAEVELENLPIYPGATLTDALSGGEEYKLLFTVEASAVDSLFANFEARFALRPTAIGRIVASAGATPTLRWLRHGEEVEGDWQGFRHY